MFELRRPSRSRQRFAGQRGFTLIDILFVVALIGILASIAAPGLLRARSRAGAASALGTLRVINSGQLSYAIGCGYGFYAPSLVTLGTPPPGSPNAFVPPDLGSAASVTKSGYLFQMAAGGVGIAPASCNGVGAGQGSIGYRAAADPQDVASNSRYFGTNASGVIYENLASMFAIMTEDGPPPAGTPIQ